MPTQNLCKMFSTGAGTPARSEFTIWTIILYSFILIFIMVTITMLNKVFIDRTKSFEKKRRILEEDIIFKNKGKVRKWIAGYEIDSNLFEWSVDPKCQKIGILDETPTYFHFPNNKKCKCGWVLK